MWNDLFNGYLTFHAYAIRPDYNYVYFGDTSDNKQSIELFSRWLVDALTTGTGSALGQGLSIEIGQNSRPGYDYSGADGWLLALLYDATRDGQATPRAQLPTYHWHGKGAEDVAVLRSGWGAADTYAWLSCGDYFGAHQHDEVGAFQIFRRAILTGSDGYYDSFDSPHWSNYYSQHSVHANTISVTAPGEFFPNTISLADKSKNVNDGGQRVLRRDDKGSAYPSPNLMQYMTEKNTGTQYETGTMQDVTQDACAGYVACDATAAYDSPGHVTNGNAAKVSEVTRQMVMLSADWFVIFDRVEATDPSYPKAFLLHTPGPPTVSGGDFSVDNGTGRLVGRALLPAAPTLTTVTNFTVAGMSYPPAQAGNESGGTRIEIAPSAAAARDYFLVVLGATDASTQRVPQTTVDDAPDAATLTLDDGTTKWVVRFPKSGPLGGHVTVTKGSQTVCDEALGGGGGGDGGMGGGDMAGQPGRDLAAGGGDGGGGGGMPGGCSCAVGGRSARGIGWVLVLGVVAVVGRPRPRLRPRVG
jgi:hypothetical protein